MYFYHSLYVCMYMYTLYTHIYANICVRVYLHIHMEVANIYTSVYVCVSVHVCVCVYLNIRTLEAPACYILVITPTILDKDK